MNIVRIRLLTYGGFLFVRQKSCQNFVHFLVPLLFSACMSKCLCFCSLTGNPPAEANLECYRHMCSRVKRHFTISEKLQDNDFYLSFVDFAAPSRSSSVLTRLITFWDDFFINNKIYWIIEIKSKISIVVLG